MSVFYHPYALHSRGSLNAVSRRKEFHGALILVDEGVGCLHPWPEFGDAPVKEQLELLSADGTSKVIERALHMAQVDGAARKAGVSLFADLQIPASHYSWDQHQSLDSQVERIHREGWQAVKGKGTRDLEQVTEWLEDLSAALSDPSIKLRVDFNSCLEAEDFTELLASLSDATLQRLDFVEDPFHYEPALWCEMQLKYDVRLALDKQLHVASDGYDVAVIKPARRDWRKLVPTLAGDSKLMFTSAMDHAVGQSFAAYEAALAARELGSRLDLCGLCTEHLFAKDEFFARISSHGGNLAIDRAGTGLGFDEVLKTLPWLKL
jgi:o-succinylbenzoate synthase